MYLLVLREMRQAGQVGHSISTALVNSFLICPPRYYCICTNDTYPKHVLLRKNDTPLILEHYEYS